MNINLTKEKAQEIVADLIARDPISLEMLGDDWIDGYKTGFIDLLIILGITVDQLKKHAGYEVESAKLPQKTNGSNSKVNNGN